MSNIGIRTLTEKEAAIYAAGGSVRRLKNMMRAKIIPAPIYKNLYDVKALDDALDKFRSMGGQQNTQTNLSDDAFDKWMKDNEEKFRNKRNPPR